MHNTRKPRIGQFMSIDVPNLSLCFSLQSQPIPHKHTLQLHWSLHTQSPKRSITKSNCSVPTLQNPLQEIFIPFPWQSPTSSIITRPHTTMFSGAWMCHLISYFQKTILFTSLPKSESRLPGLSPFAVTYGYASMSMQLDLEMWGLVSRVSLGCCCVVFGT